MKPKVISKKCGANENACTILKICPVGATRYTKAVEPILDKTLCCGCDCGDNSNTYEPNPYGRIAINYDKCTGCGICAEKCCGNAVEMVWLNKGPFPYFTYKNGVMRRYSRMN